MRVTFEIEDTSRDRAMPDIVEEGLPTIEALRFRAQRELWAQIGNVWNVSNLDVSEVVLPWDVIKYHDNHGNSGFCEVSSVRVSIGQSSDSVSVSGVEFIRGGING